MKLKYKLFFSIFPFSLVLVSIAFMLISNRERNQRNEHVDALFASSLAGLSEYETRSEEALKLSASLLSLEPVWASISAANEKDLVASTLSALQKRAAIDLLFYVGPEGTIHDAVWSGDRWTMDDVKTGLSGFFLRNGEPRKKSGFFSLQGKIYQAATAPVAMSGQNGYVGVAVLFPFGSYLHAAAGLDSAISGRDGHWSGNSFAISSEDALKLTNLNGDDPESVQLGNGTYLARIVKLDPEVASLRLALLLPSASFSGLAGDLKMGFALLLLIALLVSSGITWGVSQSISQPLEQVAKAARDMLDNGSPISAPSSLAERKDEVGQVAASFNMLAKSLNDELKQKEKALSKLEKYQTQLLDLNHRLGKKLFENRVMLSLWKEQEKAEDTKDFLSHILEELLQGLPFQYGCIIIRPLAQIGPEVILARIERTHSGKEEVSVTDILERSDRTLWLSSLSPELKEFLLRTNQASANSIELLQEVLTASIEPDSPVKNLNIVSLRLAQGKEHMGSLHLIAEKERFTISASEEEFLLSVAAQVSVALENRSLQFSTRVDPLTRLYNRGYMNDRLREEMLRSSRTNHPFTLMLLDIDNFKKVNDTHGHPAGDEVLLGLSSLLKRSSRASDALCRYGGEEIALILVDTSLAGAKTFAENLRKTIEAENFSIPDGKTLKITASMGLAEFPSQAGSMAELVKHADLALYQAKRGGRNIWRAFSA